jgi:hypothetical protein
MEHCSIGGRKLGLKKGTDIEAFTIETYFPTIDQSTRECILREVCNLFYYPWAIQEQT